jgi:hypothetical protein
MNPSAGKDWRSLGSQRWQGPPDKVPKRVEFDELICLPPEIRGNHRWFRADAGHDGNHGPAALDCLDQATVVAIPCEQQNAIDIT